MSDAPIICTWCCKPIEGTKQSEVSPTSAFTHENSCDHLFTEHGRKQIDEQVSEWCAEYSGGMT